MNIQHGKARQKTKGTWQLRVTTFCQPTWLLGFNAVNIEGPVAKETLLQTINTERPQAEIINCSNGQCHRFWIVLLQTSLNAALVRQIAIVSRLS